MSGPSGDTVDQVARRSYGRLIAFLSARSRDVGAAEDALADAFRLALETWPNRGVPNNLEAWLLTAGRRRLADQAKHRKVTMAAVPDLLALTEEAVELAQGETSFPDERLKLLFVCAHSAIDAAVHTPLMLQTVLGLDARRIGAAFLVPAATMGQRLRRAKLKIRAAGISFDVPDSKDLGARVQGVMDAIYVAYGSGWDDPNVTAAANVGLAAEALELGRLVMGLWPDEPEVEGLLALMLYCEARRSARRDEKGAYVPLSEQDTSQWSGSQIDEAEVLLARASQRGRLGRYQLEAAIQSVHSQRATTGRTDWSALSLLYEGLVQIAPSVGATLGKAAVAANVGELAQAITTLDNLPHETIATHQPYWALRAELLRRDGQGEVAQIAYQCAIDLTADNATRYYLNKKRSERKKNTCNRGSETHLRTFNPS